MKTIIQILCFVVSFTFILSCGTRSKHETLSGRHYREFFYDLKEDLKTDRLSLPLKKFDWEKNKSYPKQSYFSHKDTLWFKRQYGSLTRNTEKLNDYLIAHYKVINPDEVKYLSDHWMDVGTENGFYTISYPIFNLTRDRAIINIVYNGGKYESYDRLSIYEKMPDRWREKERIRDITW